MEESDEEMEKSEGHEKTTVEEEEEDEIIESDIELEGETVEPDNDPPQKVGSILFIANRVFLLLTVIMSILGLSLKY